MRLNLSLLVSENRSLLAAYWVYLCVLIGLFWVFKSLFCVLSGPMPQWVSVGLFWAWKGLFFVLIGLFWVFKSRFGVLIGPIVGVNRSVLCVYL